MYCTVLYFTVLYCRLWVLHWVCALVWDKKILVLASGEKSVPQVPTFHRGQYQDFFMCVLPKYFTCIYKHLEIAGVWIRWSSRFADGGDTVNEEQSEHWQYRLHDLSPHFHLLPTDTQYVGGKYYSLLTEVWQYYCYIAMTFQFTNNFSNNIGMFLNTSHTTFYHSITTYNTADVRHFSIYITA